MKLKLVVVIEDKMTNDQPDKYEKQKKLRKINRKDSEITESQTDETLNPITTLHFSC